LNEELTKACEALDAFATQVTNAWGNESTMTEAIGWNCPALTRHDLAALPRLLARDLRNAAPDSLDEHLLPLVRDIPRRLQILQTNTLPQVFGGNSTQAVPAFVNTFVGLRSVLSTLLDWQVVNDSKAMPAALARRVRSISAELEQLAPKKDALEAQISDIRRAHAAAESLPLDLQALAEARNSLAQAVDESTVRAKEAAANSMESYRRAEAMKKVNEEAERVLRQCEEAYRASTSRGLAAAFDQRATRLGLSMVVWTVGLIAALATGAYLGVERIQTLSTALAAPDPRWGAILMHSLLSMASIGAPIWFAWLATMQIGQRFRLAEDYSFKAAVARAYEGYRKEAARIDAAFEARLFDSALTRLEEAPLRLVESSAHGSPWHELVNSPAFAKALDTVPELQEKLAEISKSAFSALVRKQAKTDSQGDLKSTEQR
jgi:hypothetical protein